MKRFLSICAIVLVLTALFAYGLLYTSFAPLSKLEEAPSYRFQVQGKEIYRLQEDTQELFTIKGVDIGSGMPGHFSSEFAIDYDMYLEWFRLIQEMNANVIRVYTIGDPAFYEAFYDYNVNNPDPLYLLHGVWVDDTALRSSYDAYHPNFLDAFQNDCKTLVDVLHGRRGILYNSRYGSGYYDKDVSPWVAGYILGVEWDQDVVLYTDDMQEQMASYDGTFLYTGEDASAFEAMLARAGDTLLEYEMRKYGEQRLLAFSNWPETDPLEHTIWSVNPSNLSQVDVEHIHMKDSFKPGMFASYHIYPYYPFFLNFEREYAEYVDETGAKNPYRGYLEAINDHHTIPVVIAEFGLPSSRGIAHLDTARGMNQGHLSEAEQGERLAVLYQDIQKSGCAGAIVFSWQDEWFKQTWNTIASLDLSRTAYWSDAQTNEQAFGLITFDPGEEKSIVYVDGDVSEWADTPWLLSDETSGLQMAYDEKYLYFHVYVKDRKDGDIIYLPVDLTPKSGACSDGESGLTFEQPVDFLIRLDGTENSAVMVQERYNTLYATERREIWKRDAFINPVPKDSPVFSVISQLLRRELIFTDGTRTDVQLFPTGELRHGIANPDSPDFDSIADFYISGDHIEIRLPWALFNFSDPSRMMIHDDYYVNYGIQDIEADHMDVSMQLKRGSEITVLPFASLELKGWGADPSWHMRIKDSYYAMQKAFGEVD